MSLTDQQLFDNFSTACYIFANANGDNNFNNNSFKLFDDGTHNIQITYWNSTAPQPTISQLKAISLTQLTNYKNLQKIKTQIKNNILPAVTNNQATQLLSLPNGTMIFNTDLLLPQILISGVWKSFTLI